MQPSSKKIFMAVIQVAVFMVSVYYIFGVVNDNFSAIKDHAVPHVVTLLCMLFASAVIYAVLMLFLSWAWQALTSSQLPQSTVGVYLKSQALKYLPGNVFHFVYRHAASLQLGLEHKTLVTAALHETIWLLGCGLLLGLTGLLFFATADAANLTLPLLEWWLPAATVLIAVLLYLLYRNYPGGLYLQLLLTYLSYFLGMGLICCLLAYGLGLENNNYLLLTAAYACAWLVGYIVPGAPGGLGVRESIFTLMMSTLTEAHLALILITTLRLMTLITEVLIYFFAERLSQATDHLWVWSDRTKQ